MVGIINVLDLVRFVMYFIWQLYLLHSSLACLDEWVVL